MSARDKFRIEIVTAHPHPDVTVYVAELLWMAHIDEEWHLQDQSTGNTPEEAEAKLREFYASESAIAEAPAVHV